MSELEIKRRREYKQNRKKWMIIQVVAIVLIAVIALGSFLIYDRMNRTYYIEYTENSRIDYTVSYKENDFFDENTMGPNKEYITSLIDGITAEFSYAMNMGVTNVGFNYSYIIEATLRIEDEDSGNPYYSHTDILVPYSHMSTMRTKGVSVGEPIEIDFLSYNKKASDFIKTYNLKNASATLIVQMKVEVISTSDYFQQQNENTYSTALNIPLAEETFSIFTTASSPEGESKVVAFKGSGSRALFYVAGIVASALAAILILVLAIYAHMTRNEDITYAAKVRKILSAYGSFIQRMEGEFDSEGYQIVMIKTFTEMLGIRDTLQAPVLMMENSDETMTQFLIPTNTKLLYVFEIKVDNYDEIYGL